MPAFIGQVPPGRRQTLIGVGMAIALGALAYLAAWGWSQLFPAPVFTAAAPSGCELHAGPCSATFGSGRSIELELEPKTLPANQPLRILVDAGGLPADRASVEFSGIDMNMGLISASLLNTGDGTFSGDVILPVCVRRAMAWQATVVTKGTAGTHRATFRFEVNRP